MNKANRLGVYKKYHGHCAYCGKRIRLDEMQIDHIHPKALSHFYKSLEMIKLHGLKGKNVDSFENLNPSCRRCNHYKRSLTLEEFRTDLLGNLHERVLNHYTVKVAVDYGIITIKPFNKVFYFERFQDKEQKV